MGSTFDEVHLRKRTKNEVPDTSEYVEKYSHETSVEDITAAVFRTGANSSRMAFRWELIERAMEETALGGHDHLEDNDNRTQQHMESSEDEHVSNECFETDNHGRKQVSYSNYFYDSMEQLRIMEELPRTTAQEAFEALNVILQYALQRLGPSKAVDALNALGREIAEWGIDTDEDLQTDFDVSDGSMGINPDNADAVMFDLCESNNYCESERYDDIFLRNGRAIKRYSE
jgi:hypothetical protein